MQVQEIDDGLWRWTTPHPRWRPEMGGPGGWERDVGSVACELEGTLAIFDPMLAPGHDALPDALDQRARDRRVAIFLTGFWHQRHAEVIQRRYDAVVWASPAAAARVRCEVSHLVEGEGLLRAGIVAMPLRGVDEAEVVYILTAYRALVVGELLIGTTNGLRVCTAPNVTSVAEWSASVGRLSTLDVERVLPAHGQPVLRDGRDAIAGALAKPEWNSERPA